MPSRLLSWQENWLTTKGSVRSLWWEVTPERTTKGGKQMTNLSGKKAPRKDNRRSPKFASAPLRNQQSELCQDHQLHQAGPASNAARRKARHSHGQVSNWEVKGNLPQGHNNQAQLTAPFRLLRQQKIPKGKTKGNDQGRMRPPPWSSLQERTPPGFQN